MTLDNWCVAYPEKARKLLEKLGKAQFGRYRNGSRIPRPKQMAAIVVATDGLVMPTDFYLGVIPPRFRHTSLMQAAE